MVSEKNTKETKKKKRMISVNFTGKELLNNEVFDTTKEAIAKEHNIKVSGFGKINAFDLVTDNTDIVISGSGEANVNANEELDVKISGFAKVNYKGDPAIEQSVSGSGKIKSVE